jgi:hypothetical protein
MRSLSAAFAALFLSSFSAFAADAPTCEGELWIVRKSRIVEGGTMEGFLQAIEAQMAWYRANGIVDNETAVGPVQDAALGATPQPVENIVMTIHMDSPSGPADGLPYGDAEWDAFVRLFGENSEIVEETRFCNTGY